MTVDYVVDTNIFILLFNNQLEELIPEGRLAYSVITEIELLSFPNLSDTDAQLIQQQLSQIRRVPLDEAVSAATIRLRRQHRLKIPDAIILASAEVMDATLLTNDQQLVETQAVKTRSLKLKEV